MPVPRGLGGAKIEEMQQVTIEKATSRLGDLVDAAIAGEEIILTRQDQSAVRLVPIAPAAGASRRPRFGSAKGLIQMSDDFDAPLEDFREYME